MPSGGPGPEDVRRGLPYAVGVGVRRVEDGMQVPALLPAEGNSLGPRVAERRRTMFALGRAAARDALAELGIRSVAIGRGTAGEPLWPDDVVGAISHSGEVALAVVGWRAEYAGLGIDVEQLSPGLSARAARLVCTPAEMAWLDGARSSTQLTTLFSAKEAVFKATFPIARVWLGFSDAELSWQPPGRSFLARLLKAAGPAHPAGTTLDVRCTLMETQVLSTTYALPGPPVS